MSQENVEVVRRATAPYNGQDAVQVVRKMFAEVDWSDRDAVEAALAGTRRAAISIQTSNGTTRL